MGRWVRDVPFLLWTTTTVDANVTLSFEATIADINFNASHTMVRRNVRPTKCPRWGNSNLTVVCPFGCYCQNMSTLIFGICLSYRTNLTDTLTIIQDTRQKKSNLLCKRGILVDFETRVTQVLNRLVDLKQYRLEHYIIYKRTLTNGIHCVSNGLQYSESRTWTWYF